MNCLNKLIDLKLQCAEADTQTGYVYQLTDISWLNEAVFSRIVDNRFQTIDQLKQSLFRKAVVELSNEMSSFISSKIQLKDFVGYFNDYGSTKIGCQKDENAKGLLIEKNTGCSGVKLVLGDICFRHNPSNSSTTSLSFSIILDDEPAVSYNAVLSSTGKTCVTVSDAEGNPLRADSTIFIYTNSEDIEFCSLAIPCQTGCSGSTNPCASVKGTYGNTNTLKQTYGISASVSCQCDFSDLFCNPATKSRIAELLLIRLEHHIAKYAFDSSRMDVFKIKAEAIIETLKSNNLIYSEKFVTYIEPIAFEIARNKNYKPCSECRGVQYGIN